MTSLLLGSFKFAELNIRHCGSKEKTAALVRRAVRMGYDAVVINVDAGDPYESAPGTSNDDEPPKKKKKKGGGGGGGTTTLPDPVLVDESRLDVSGLSSEGRRFRQFSRLTVSLNEPSLVHTFLNDPKLKKFDIVAIRPGSEAILSTLTRKTDYFDVITYEQTSMKVPWLFRGRMLEQCVAEGIFCEINYAPALCDSSERRQVLANARQLVKMCRGKSVVLSSGAELLLDLRAPFDTMNLALLFGVDAQSARDLISENAKQLLLRAEAKKAVRGTVALSTLDDVPTRSKSKQEALAALLSVPEFKLQIERVPPKVSK